MAQDRTITPGYEPDVDGAARPVAGAVLTRAEYAALARELEALEAKHRSELAQRLRLARGFGGSADSDDLLAVVEDAAVDQARIAQLEELLISASVVDDPARADGAAALGATVRVADDAGRIVEYDLVGRRSGGVRRDEVTPASPVGLALMGVRVGDVVRVELPSGRARVLRVLAVSYQGAAAAA